MDILEDNDLVMVNRGGVNYKLSGSGVKQHNRLLDSDLLLVQEEGQLYQVSVGTLRTNAINLVNGPTNLFLVQRGDQLFSCENPFRRQIAPQMVFEIDTSGLDGSKTALGVAIETPRKLDGFPPVLLFLDSANQSVVKPKYWSLSTDNVQFTVQDAIDFGIAKCVLVGGYGYFSTALSEALTTVNWTGGADGWTRMFVDSGGTPFGEAMFFGCPKLTNVFGMSGYGDAPPAGFIKSLQGCFRNCTLFNGDISSWDTSAVTNMQGTFANCENYNKTLAAWDVSKVTTFKQMFKGAQLFNQPLNSWNVSKGKTFEGMFQSAQAFARPLDQWVLTALNEPTVDSRGLTTMFNDAQSFNEDLTGWCVKAFDSEPNNFSSSSALDPNNLPVWGTCP